MLLTSQWSNLMSALSPLTSGLLAGFCLCLCHLLSLHSAPLSWRVPEESHEWRSLVGYSPWGRKESDTTERLQGTHATGWD